MVQAGTQTNLYYVHTDQLGTPRAMTDANQKVIWRWDSDPFGLGAANDDPDGDGTKITMNLRFPGQYYDAESGLHYNYHRYYDPQTGRYVTSDPIGLGGGLNTFGYVHNNSIRLIDPMGLDDGFIFISRSVPIISRGHESANIGGEIVGIHGYDTTRGWYIGYIGAGGGEIDNHSSGISSYVGKEHIYYWKEKCWEDKDIEISDFNIFGWGAGWWSIPGGESGPYFFRSGGNNSAGFGVSWPNIPILSDDEIPMGFSAP